MLDWFQLEGSFRCGGGGGLGGVTLIFSSSQQRNVEGLEEEPSCTLGHRVLNKLRRDKVRLIKT